MTIHHVNGNRQIEERLANNKEIIKYLIDNIPVMLILWEPDLQKFTLNHHAESVLGWTMADADEGDIMCKVFPDPVYRSEIETFMQSLSPEWREQKMTAKDGSIIPTTWTNTRLSDETMIGIGLDLRERDRVLTALQESDENFHMALAHSNFIPSRFDRNQRYCWIHNPHPDFDTISVIGKRDDEIDDSQGARYLGALKRQVIETGKGVREEIAFDRSDGTHWYEFSIEPIRNTEGKVIGGTSSAYDISRQKLAELSLRESEERFKLMTDGLPLIVWVHDAEGRQQFVNHTFLEFFGVTEEETKDDRWQLLMHPDDAETYAGEFSACVRQRRFFHAIARVRNASGDWRWLESWGKPRFSSSGEFLGYVGTSADITERKETEEALKESEARNRAILDAVPDLLFICDRHGVVLEYHASDKSLLAVQPAAFLNKVIHEFLPEDVANSLWEGMERVLGTKKNQLVEYALELSGRIRFFEARISLMCDGRLIAIIRDITERKHAEEELHQLNESLEQQVAERTAEAEQRAEALRQLALELSSAEDLERRRIAMILHDDLQQYLAAIRFRIGSLIPDALSSPQITEQITSVESLIDESIQKCRNLSHELSPPVLDQNGLIPALEWLSQDMKEKYGLEVKLQADPGAEPASLKLATVLFRSIRELLFNIVKHADTDRAVLQVRSKDDSIHIHVSDPGRGFDVNQSRITQDVRSGFGLFSVEERTHFLGGTFYVKSAPGEGTQIDICVPNQLARPEKSVELMPDIADKPAVEYGQAAQNRGRIRILLADDHAVMRDGLIRILQNQSDLEVVAQAENGLEAVQMADQVAPDVILMDITMPELDGIAATEKILKKHPWVRIIGLSMHDDPSTEERMRRAGAWDYIYKASPSDVIVQTIRMSVKR
jgi:PAS domain S-box-containing protein